jgi:acyl-CoA thioester hydrolase
MLETTTYIDTRYPDCDRMGIVHHAVYPVWYEIARMDFFAAMGFSFSDMNALGINPAMVDLHLQYKAAATYPQRLRIVTSISRYAPKKLELSYRCYAEGLDEPINTAVTFHIWTGPDNRSCDLAVTLPEVYRKIEEAAE